MTGKILLSQSCVNASPFKPANRHLRGPVPRRMSVANSTETEACSSSNNMRRPLDESKGFNTVSGYVTMRAGSLALSLCLALSSCPSPSAAYNVRLRDVENPAMQSGETYLLFQPCINSILRLHRSQQISRVRTQWPWEICVRSCLS